MNGIRRMSQTLILMLLILTAVGCGGGSIAIERGSPEVPEVQVKAAGPETEEPAESCNAIIDWVDFLMINGIKYHYNYEGSGKVSDDQLGEKLGEVSYMLNDHACTDYEEKDGDAAFLPIGTAIYAMKGYKPEFRVIANSKIYEVSDNPNAATLGQLFDIEGKVDKVGLESAQDGSPIGDFSAEASAQFIQELLPLQHVGFNQVYEKTKHESGIFLRVYLLDGTSFRLVYYPEGNGFTAGAFGTESLKTLIMEQRAHIKAAAGL
ncbi:hypothetical protein SAMN04487969_112128 [Paenibacillus algorifonticola]|uniref:Lipoprotein n=1 Tax=Paenibacillus algorifonticola TaxID=684063 RepID=A0A1I2FJL7_9BACL|nr:hypothetical protein [Paenibacillus algorifonticola]SFF05475.1 hypothetical protein SAMN04487969_112128 [Paenibacillus algorifonticola]